MIYNVCFYNLLISKYDYAIQDKKMEFASVPVIDTWRAMEKLGKELEQKSDMQ